MNQRRVVVTGLGAITPVGNDIETAWRALLAGQSGIAELEGFDTTNYATKIAGQIKGFEADKYGIEPKEARKMDSFIQYGVAAAHSAIHDAGLNHTPSDPFRFGVSIGSGIGGLGFIEKSHEALTKSGPRRVSPFFIPGAIINMISGYVSMQFGFQGPNLAFATACTTGCHSIGMAARSIACGDADVMVAGGAEKASTPLGISGFGSVKALSTCNDEPEKASRPFDKDRSGFVLGDGAGVVVLEEYEHAKQRGARIYSEVIGFGMSGDAYHITSPAPEGKGMAQAMINAVRDAGVNNDEIGYINAHGTSTKINDAYETAAIKLALGDAANQVAISSTKSMTGHLLGAAGAIETIWTILSLRDKICPPTINLDNPDEACDLDYIPNKAREIDLEVAMSNSFGFGGTNGAIVLRRV